MKKTYSKPDIVVNDTIVEEHLCFESKVHGAMNGKIEETTEPDFPPGWGLAKEYFGDFDRDSWDNEFSEYASW